MMKLSICILALVAGHLTEFSPEHVGYVCVAYSNVSQDPFAQNPGSVMQMETVDNYDKVKEKHFFIIHQGPCGHVYCPEEYACICNEGNVYHNVCHMRSLGVYKGVACDCTKANAQTSIKNPAALSTQLLKDYARAQKGAATSK